MICLQCKSRFNSPNTSRHIEIHIGVSYAALRPLQGMARGLLNPHPHYCLWTLVRVSQ